MDLYYKIYWSAMLIALVAAIVRGGWKDQANVVFIFYLTISIAFEVSCFFIALRYQNNMPLSHIYCPIELSVLLLFIYSLLKGRVPGWVFWGLALLGGLLAAINAVYWQDIHIMNSNFLLFESVCFISVGLYYLYNVFKDEDDVPLRAMPHFWIVIMLLLFWTSTFFMWGFWSVIVSKKFVGNRLFSDILCCIAVGTYAGYAAIYLFCKPKPALARE